MFVVYCDSPEFGIGFDAMFCASANTYINEQEKALNNRETQNRAALIQLGWTLPADGKIMVKNRTSGTKVYR